jgi:hypothetical protein
MNQAGNLVRQWRVLGAIFALALLGCKDSPVQPSAGSLSLSLRFVSNNARKALPKAETFAPVAVDSIRLTRVRLVLSKIELESANDSAEFRSAPMVLEADLSGAVQTLAVAGVPFGSYEEVEFNIYRADSSDLASIPIGEQARFAEFLQDPAASIILAGLAFTNRSAQSFTYRSDLNVKQEYDLAPPLTVSETNPTANLTINVDASNWFKDESGALLDPADPKNRHRIDNNIKTSLKVYEDDDRDGEDDDGG